MSSKLPAKFPRGNSPVGTLVRPMLHDRYIVPSPDALEYQLPDRKPGEHYHYVVMGFEWADSDSGQMIDTISFDVSADSAEQAIRVAVEMAGQFMRPFWRITGGRNCTGADNG